MKNILVTGASGFLGTQVLKHLNRNGYCIHAIGRNKSPLNDNCGVHWHSIDLLDSVETRKLLRLVRAEGLIHLAWETEHSIYWNSPNNLNWVEASLSLARDFAFYGGERIVIAGTSAEYEWGSLFDLNERKSTIAPSSLYGKSKNDLNRLLKTPAKTIFDQADIDF